MNLHVLLIPSEEFVPPQSHLAGIFQLHQAKALQAAGVKTGALSVKLLYSLPMLLKGAVARAMGRPGSPKLPSGTPGSLLRLMFRKRFRLEEFVTHDSVEGIPVTRIEGGYDFKPGERFDHRAWTRAGEAAYEAYAARHGRPDILHAHNALYGGMLAASLSRKHGIPFVLTEHSSFVARRTVARSLLRHAARCYRSAAELLTVSPSLGRQLEENTGPAAAGWKWVPNVIDPDLLEQPPAPRPVRGKPRVLSVGNLIPLKDHATLLRAFAGLPGHESMELVIAGDGPEENPLRELARDLGISAQTTFTGRLSRDQVVAQMDAASCLVLPSRFETFGVVLIEALSRGIPVVASRCGGPECVVTDANGKLFPAGDAAALTAALEPVLRNPEHYNPAALRHEAIDRFGPRRLSATLIDFYRRTLEGPAAS